MAGSTDTRAMIVEKKKRKASRGEDCDPDRKKEKKKKRLQRGEVSGPEDRKSRPSVVKEERGHEDVTVIEDITIEDDEDITIEDDEDITIEDDEDITIEDDEDDVEFMGESVGPDLVKLTRSIMGRMHPVAFQPVLNFFSTEGARRAIEAVKRNGIKLTNLSGVLNGAGKATPKAFVDLYHLWVDETGRKSRYLQNLDRCGVNLSSVSGILGKSGSGASKAFLELYDLWFDSQGNPTRYLTTLHKEQVKLNNFTCILSYCGVKGPKAFKDLYNLCFDEQGKKTRYLVTLEKQRIHFSTVSSIMRGSRSKAPAVFVELYDLWFNEHGEKSGYLLSLETHGICLKNITSVLTGIGSGAPEGFVKFYNLLLDAEGNKTRYLQTLEKAGFNIGNISNALSGSGQSAPQVFVELFNLLFDNEGRKTRYLTALEDAGINVVQMCRIVHSARRNTPEAFKQLCDLWFDSNGRQTLYLKALEREGINLARVSDILTRTGTKAPQCFVALYNLWFDERGNRTPQVAALEKEGVRLANLCEMLCGARLGVVKVFTDLYNHCLDGNGNKTKYLAALERAQVDFSQVSRILSHTGSEAPRAFRDLYDFCFDRKGNKSEHLKALEKESVTLGDMCPVLSGTGPQVVKVFRELYNLWFDNHGNKTECLRSVPANLLEICIYLEGKKIKAAKAFQQFFLGGRKRRSYRKEGSRLGEATASSGETDERLDDIYLDQNVGNPNYLERRAADCLLLKGNAKKRQKSGKDVSCLVETPTTLRTVRGPLPDEPLDIICLDKNEGVSTYLKNRDGHGPDLKAKGKKRQKSRKGGSTCVKIPTGSSTGTGSEADNPLDVICLDHNGGKTNYLECQNGDGPRSKRKEGRFSAEMPKTSNTGTGSEADNPLDVVCLDENDGNSDLEFRDVEGSCSTGSRKKRQNCRKEWSPSVEIRMSSSAGRSHPDELLDIICLNQNSGNNDLEHGDGDGPCSKGNPKKRQNCREENSSWVDMGEADKSLDALWFDSDGRKTKYLKSLEAEGVSATRMTSILGRAGSQVFKELYDLWFDDDGRRRQCLETLEKEAGITLAHLSCHLVGRGAKAAGVFRRLYGLWFDADGRKTRFLEDFYGAGFDAGHLSQLLSLAGDHRSSRVQRGPAEDAVYYLD